MGKILTEISEAELLDKISILEIKQNKIKNPDSLSEINKELSILNKIKDANIKSTDQLKKLYLNLKNINEKIWKIENDKRQCEKDSNFKEDFISLSREEYFANDERAQTKSEINNLLNSNIREIKDHPNYKK
jgi:hypothetical protein